MRRKRLTWITATLITGCILLLSQCVDQDIKNQADDADTEMLPAGFAGSVSCRGCHPDIYESHVNTAHFKTTRPAEERYLMGSFHPDSNHFYFNRSVQVAMEQRDSA